MADLLDKNSKTTFKGVQITKEWHGESQENDVWTKWKDGKERENLRRNQKEIMELKSTIPDMKNSQEGFKGRFEWAEERIC